MTKSRPSAIRVIDLERIQRASALGMIRVTTHSGRTAAAIIARASPWSGRSTRPGNVMGDLLRFFHQEEWRALMGGSR
jgi:hypothetical protein